MDVSVKIAAKEQLEEQKEQLKKQLEAELKAQLEAQLEAKFEQVNQLLAGKLEEQTKENIKEKSKEQQDVHLKAKREQLHGQQNGEPKEELKEEFNQRINELLNELLNKKFEEKSMGQPESQLKTAIVEMGRRLYDKGMVAANDGNISVRAADGNVWATPTGVSKGFLQPDLLVKLDLAGQVLAGTSRPSSEIKMHLNIYRQHPQIGAVVHAHPPFATALAVAGIPLDQALLTEGVVNLGVIPVAGYAAPGSRELALAAAAFCGEYNGVLLANHGAVAWGKNLTEAFYRLESIEYVAKITTLTEFVLQKSRKLSTEQVQELLQIRQGFGVQTGGVPRGGERPCNLEDVPGQPGKGESK